MKKSAVLGVAMAVILAAQPAWALVAPNDMEPVVDISFDDGGVDGFTTYTNGGECSISNTDGTLTVDITSCGNLDYANQVYWDGLSLKEGVEYTYSFDASCDIERQIEYRIQLNGGDYHAYVGDFITVGPENQTFSVDFTMEEPTDPAPRIAFNMGFMTDMQEDPGPHRVTLDNICLVITDDSGAVEEGTEDDTGRVAVNQIGYRPSSEKTVIYNGGSAAETFAIVDASTGENVFEGKLSSPVQDAATDSLVMKGDFTGLETPGTYSVCVETPDGPLETPGFVIADDAYEEVYRAAVKMLDLQRCGTELPEESAGAYVHPVCHAGEAVIYGTEETKDVAGGWHDAGDYGRYVVAGAKAAADLMLAFEDYDLTDDDLGIPESGNGIPDILDEVRWELEWMLKMQEPATGGVYHKVTCKVFPGTVMPEDETDTLYLAPVSTAATGDFAAVCAKAAGIYRPWDGAFADKMLEAARAAWNYVKDSEDTEGFRNPDEIVTGEYPDSETGDEVFWAAAELFLAGEPGTEAVVDRRFRDDGPGFGWADISGYALYDLVKGADAAGDVSLSAEKTGSVPSEAASTFAPRAREALLAEAERICGASDQDGFGVALGTEIGRAHV